VAICQTEVSADGFDIIRLRNSCMSVGVMPQLGGKILEMVDLGTGRDWLWKNPYIPLRHPRPGMDYDRQLDSGGWDEILFSVKPCSLDLPGGRHLSFGDHGSLVDKAWKTTEAGIDGAGAGVCELLAQGQSPHFQLQRRIVLDANQPRLELEYKLTNTGSVAWPWLWCAHPLLAIESGMHIGLKEGQTIRPSHGDASGSGVLNGNQAWPLLESSGGTCLDLAGIFKPSSKPETFCAKLFVRSTEEVCVSTADGAETLRMRYSPQHLPWLGLWINKNAWSGCGSEPYLNLGLEPATAPHETLAEAVAHGQADILPAGGTRDWSLAICLDNTVNTHG